MILVLLGAFATAAIANVDRAHAPVSHQLTSGVSTTIPRNVGRALPRAVQAQCVADYQSIQIAIGTYRALNGTAPPGGTSWAMASTKGGPFLPVWPSNTAYFFIRWNGRSLSVAPTRAIVSRGTFGSRSACLGA